MGLRPLRARALEQLRRICLALPKAEETETFGNPTFQVGGKTFAVFDLYKGEYAICFKATLEDQTLLTQDPAFYISPYIGRHGWTSQRLSEDIEWTEVEELVRSSYELVAPRRPARRAKTVRKRK